MSQPYGAAISSKSPLHGQKHRSGPNFRFLKTLPRKRQITVTITGTPNPDSVKAQLFKDHLGLDKSIADLSNGSTFDGSKIKDPNLQDYYIGNPSGATEDFVVIFTI